ncbi:MAG: hypothetical protein U9N81_13300 [Bacillota bacterium]|nr:hypothetical protein [Bacillota bacterium]
MDKTLQQFVDEMDLNLDPVKEILDGDWANRIEQFIATRPVTEKDPAFANMIDTLEEGMEESLHLEMKSLIESFAQGIEDLTNDVDLAAMIDELGEDLVKGLDDLAVEFNISEEKVIAISNALKDRLAS